VQNGDGLLRVEEGMTKPPSGALWFGLEPEIELFDRVRTGRTIPSEGVRNPLETDGAPAGVTANHLGG
jgi:hypothetical protein